MVWRFIVAGGWPMAPILFCSVLGLALLLERAWFWSVAWLQKDSVLRRQLLSDTGDHRRARQSRDPVCQVLRRAIAEPDDPAGAVGLAERVVRETRASVPMLQVTGAVSTSLGLLGTVLGVALAFQRSAGNPTMAELVPALSIALNTTIFGLLVYLPTFIGAQLSQMASNRLAFQLEQGINAVCLQNRSMAAREEVLV